MSTHIKLRKRLSNEDFDTYRSLARKLGNFDRDRKVYFIVKDKVKRFLLRPSALKEILRKLYDLGADVCTSRGCLSGGLSLDDAVAEILSVVQQSERVNLKFFILPQGMDWSDPYVWLTLTREELTNVLRYAWAAANKPGDRLIAPARVGRYMKLASALTFKRGDASLELVKEDGKYTFTWSINTYFVRVGVLRGALKKVLEILGREDLYENEVWWDPRIEGVYDPGKVSFLRDYQKEAVKAVLRSLAKSGGAVLQAPTGSGKTEMAVAIAKLLLDSGLVKKVLFIAHTNDLLTQARARFERYGIPTGLYSAKKENLGAPVVMASFQSLYRLITGKKSGDEFKHLIVDPELVIVDECHRGPANTFRKVLSAFTNRLTVGLSATPWRDDGLDVYLYGYIGPLAYTIELEELANKGYVSRAKIIMVNTIERVPPDVESMLLDLDARIREAKLSGNESSLRSLYSKKWNLIAKWVRENPERLEAIKEVAKMLPKPVLVLLPLKKTAKKLAEELRKEGISAEALTGDLDIETRDRILEDKRNGLVDVLVATNLADEGLDIPNLRSLILGMLGKSSTKYPQRVGRVLRKIAGKNKAIVVDIADIPVYADLPYKTFIEHAERRKEQYEEIGKRAVEVIEVSAEDLSEVPEAVERALKKD